MYYYFYKTTNLLNSKVYYGVHKTENLDDGYIGSGKLIRKAIKKYGSDNFKKDILYWFDSEEEMFEYEKQFITEDIIKDSTNYNIALGGYGGYREETVIVNRKKRLGKTWEEIYGKEKAILMKSQLSETSRGKSNPFYGKTHNEKNKKLFADNARKLHTGKKRSEETKAKIRESIKKSWENKEITDEHRKLISEKTKEGMKHVDWDKLMEKALAGRKKHWEKIHKEQREIIIDMKEKGYKVKDIMKYLNISIPTYYKRMREINKTIGNPNE